MNQQGTKTSFSSSELDHGRKSVWLHRLIAVVLGPALGFAVLETALRVANFGYPPGFLLPQVDNGNRFYAQNNQFGRRFFGAQRTRRPHPLYIRQPKPPGAVRIFVLGESAAYGDPYPAFGLAHMLEAMLSLRYPGVQFEVENAAMTAINSHAILPIARDCAAAGGDLWVIYMGNNEVVGPFGAGTIFGPQTPPLWLIRASLWAKSTRSGQLLERLISALRRSPGGGAAWGGMEMFIHQQVAADDPRMERLYQHFKRNLADILDAGLKSGAGIVLSTVAVNLRDCPPFASLHRRGLSGQDKARWDELYRLGCQAQDAGSNQVAWAHFGAAARLDGQFAELRFRQGQCALGLGKRAEAWEHFRAARDLDALRFRCDSRLNDLVRRAGAARQGERVRLADADETLAAQSQEGVPGEALFYEHVHLTFKGNFLLAKALAEQLEPLLPPAVTSRRPQPWPTQEDCAQRLAWSDFTQAEALRSMLGRLAQPPFAVQLGHEAKAHRLRAELEQLATGMGPNQLTQAVVLCEQALSAAPDDPLLCAQLGFLKRATGDAEGAVECAQRQTELLPSDLSGWTLLGAALQQQRRWQEAEAAYRRAVDLDPGDARAWLNLANLMATVGRFEDALQGCHQAVRAEPGFCLGWITLGRITENAGHREEAEGYYRKALACNTDAAQAATIATFCESRGWLEPAATNYAVGLKLDPTNVKLRLAAGKNLLNLEKYQPAVEQFREAVRLQPQSPELRIQLGEALRLWGHDREALAEFEEVLRSDPANAAALDGVSRLKAKPAAQGAPGGR
jgi:tetratricopeptide (TPR) repeat protein